MGGGLSFDKCCSTQLHESSYILPAEICALELLKLVNPVCDANMFVIYGTQNGYSVDSLTYPELTELATIYKDKLATFIDEAVKSEVIRIMDRWIAKLNSGQVTIAMEEPSYRQFRNIYDQINLVAYRFDNLNNEPIVAVINDIGMHFASLAGQVHDSIYFASSKIPVDPETVVKVFEFLFQVSKNHAFWKFDPNQRNITNRYLISLVVKLLQFIGSGLMLTNQFGQRTPHWTLWDTPDQIIQGVIVPMLRGASSSIPNDYLVQVRKARCLELCHVVALKGDWNDNLILSKRPITCETPASQLMAAMMASRIGGKV